MAFKRADIPWYLLGLWSSRLNCSWSWLSWLSRSPQCSSSTSPPVAWCVPPPRLERRCQSPRPGVGTTCLRSPDKKTNTNTQIQILLQIQMFAFTCVTSFRLVCNNNNVCNEHINLLLETLVSRSWSTFSSSSLINPASTRCWRWRRSVNNCNRDIAIAISI